ncbi:2'-5' RNA ligase family protein [Candidatus Saccharibacteria bacterium]|nr:2'-5' RNA ligase family protein [Candidatus Saccharibacteria bacterium]
MAERDEHLVVLMLEPMPDGEEFEVWPMHITIVPWFPCDDEDRLNETLAKVTQKHRAFEVKAGKIEEWGGRERFKVLKIEDDGALYRLHRDIFKNLEKNGFPIHQKEYMGEKYAPHVTLRNSLADKTRYKPGQSIKINKFTLVQQVRLRGSGRMIKSLVRDYELG